ncbi:MAG: tRNA threonylcarbamoyladenosine dehydratase [Bacteroidaceae bacterium]|nr:tRNA threonylcarbamoyladenosine dehydratase [Bacteroidaceae bacterium]
MESWLSRTIQLLGEEKMCRLENASVLVAGVGGVGGYAAEMLVRAGVGNLTIIDSDAVALSNINRQLIALHSTVGQSKVEVLASRLRDINPQLNLKILRLFLVEDEIVRILSECNYDYIVDAIDTLAPKVALICTAKRLKQKIISSMGAGGRVDPTKIMYADISKTYHCSLAKAVRKQLQKKGINSGLKVVFSAEQVKREAIIATDDERNKKSTVGTVSYLPPMFGCFLAAYVIRKLSGI